ncbi:HPr kinase/phosphorylase [Roseibium aggregatum]|uniref:HPr kinase/phosphatase C-terminal domain-containing protein n=1 Tax=Roseibium aggregatum TaxID=187304 RepID=A0A939EIG3_9HYPH|nr:HPr kinase/phosphatase C-terminal domain-containing protein [Roseibium aggregatum]MBN9672878.1 HPr kinase/phosphatase C-terminal domain-containing protein [Roseibium aggregatum]
MTEPAVHASCVVLGAIGVLIRGVSGSGKSLLAETLIEEARSKGNFAALVADDRVVLTAVGDRLLAAVPQAISGQLEVRGFGIAGMAYLPRARVHLIVDLKPLETIERLPETPVGLEAVENIPLPHVICPKNETVIGRRLIRWAIRTGYPDAPDYI